MNYELAKQLKDAGFPQDEKYEKAYFHTYLITDVTKGEWHPTGEHHICNNDRGGNSSGKWACVAPTLLELIDACGEETLVLWSYNKNWFAGLRRIRNDRDSKGRVLTDTHTLVIDYRDYKIGKTPEIAVAKLWLALNPKKRSK